MAVRPSHVNSKPSARWQYSDGCKLAGLRSLTVIRHMSLGRAAVPVLGLCLESEAEVMNVSIEIRKNSWDKMLDTFRSYQTS